MTGQDPHVHVTPGGLSFATHMCYLLFGWIPCFLGWVIWPFHARRARRRATLTIG